jgi:hypothetical protein
MGERKNAKNTMTRDEVYGLIDGERNYQNQRWADDVVHNETHRHSWEEWFMYIEDYVNEAKHILSREGSETGYPKAAAIMRKVAAMGVAAMEQNGSSPRE